MNVIESVLLGALEGFTEFLPISSTGHLILATHLFGLPATESVKSFMIAVQLGAIAAVVLLYWRLFLDRSLLIRLGVAFLPTGILGFLLYPFIKGFLLGNGAVVAWALIAGGVALIAFEQYHKEPPLSDEKAPIPLWKAFLIGLAQSVSMIPGVSRSGATIMGGLALGLSRKRIVEFSFLLAVPTMTIATGYDLMRSAHLFTPGDAITLLIGFAVSLGVAVMSMRFLLEAVQRWGFVPFGVYRILLGLAFLVYVLP